jgi:hypothetical protein
MNTPDKQMPTDFDEEFLQAIEEWREKHKIKDDDVILKLLELFRIHQNHWDEMRSRQMPSLDQFRKDIALLTQAAKYFKENTRSVDMATAFFAALAALLAGFLIGKALL